MIEETKKPQEFPRLLVCADLHLDSRFKVHGRQHLNLEGDNLFFGRQLAALGWFFREAMRLNAQPVIAGDLFGQDESRRLDTKTLARTLARCAFANDNPALTITGNHDDPWALTIACHYQYSAIHEMPDCFNDEIGIYFLPYQRRGAESVSFIPDPPFPKKNVLIFHNTIEGAICAPLAGESPLSAEYLGLFDIAIGGHIHDSRAGAGHVYYCGSLLPQNHGEENTFHGALLLEEDGRVSRIPLPAEIMPSFQTVTIEAGGALPGLLADTEFLRLRFRHNTPREDFAAAVDYARALCPRLLSIKPDPLPVEDAGRARLTQAAEDANAGGKLSGKMDVLREVAEALSMALSPAEEAAARLLLGIGAEEETAAVGKGTGSAEEAGEGE